jgi:hypothetical protein
MPTNVDVVNRALQSFGSRTTVTAAELANNSTNEAIQANLILTDYRDKLLRMAPWNCGLNTANLVYITSAPGTPENTTAGTTLWQKGQPTPPWAYEYQYPVDCLRPAWILPQFQTGFAGGIPITTAVTGGAASFWQGPPVKYVVGVDQFFPVTAATVANGGAGYAVGDLITLAAGPTTSAPIGAPAVLQVVTAPGGVIATVSVVTQIFGSATPQGGSYFAAQTNPVAQGSTTGVGTGATFNLTFGAQGDQRIILTNQEFSTLVYVKRITDPDVMDDLFLEAWVHTLGGTLCIALTGDKQLANLGIGVANNAITEARRADGNEGLTINDITPDFIRVRGISYSDYSYTPNIAFDWGPLWTPF